MKRQKLESQKTEQHEAQEQAQEQTQAQSAMEFATPEEMLRHDRTHTPVPPSVAHRLHESTGGAPPRPSWWKRLLGP